MAKSHDDLVGMPSKDETAARKEREAREQGKALPFYARKVARELVTRRKGRTLTPPKRG